MTCDCNNPKCPRSRQALSACQHCMCLTSPDFPPGSAICYSGPIYSVCCRCGHSQQMGASWGSGSITATATCLDVTARTAAALPKVQFIRMEA